METNFSFGEFIKLGTITAQLTLLSYYLIMLFCVHRLATTISGIRTRGSLGAGAPLVIKLVVGVAKNGKYLDKVETAYWKGYIESHTRVSASSGGGYFREQVL